MQHDVYDIGAAFQAIEDELIASMIRNMKRHKAEEAREGFEWAQWQAEQLRFLEEYKKRHEKKYGKKFKSINSRIEELIRAACECPAGRTVAVDKDGNVHEDTLEPAIYIVQGPEPGRSGGIYVMGGIPITSADGEVYDNA